MYCPECLKSGRKIEGAVVNSVTTLLNRTPYWDNDGKVHYPTVPFTITWTCMFNHKWVTTEKEIQNLNDEIEELKNERGSLDSMLMAAYRKLDDLQKNIDELKAEIKKIGKLKTTGPM